MGRDCEGYVAFGIAGGFVDNFDFNPEGKPDLCIYEMLDEVYEGVEQFGCKIIHIGDCDNGARALIWDPEDVFFRVFVPGLACRVEWNQTRELDVARMLMSTTEAHAAIVSAFEWIAKNYPIVAEYFREAATTPAWRLMCAYG